MKTSSSQATMLRITADINGRIIGHIFIHRKHTGKDVNLYDAGFVDVSGHMVLGIEDIPHPYHEGWIKLVHLVLEEYDVG
jgi:hypothetical protein